MRALLLTATLALGFALPSAAPATAADKTTISTSATLGERRGPEPTYQVDIGLDGEIYPAFANYASLQPQERRTWGTVAVTISNPTDHAIRQRVAVVLPGWSDEEIQIAEMGAGAVRTYLFAPTFLPRFYQNHELAAATLRVSVHDMGGREIYQGTKPARLRSAGDMFWGTKFRYAPFIASWVTPHAPEVEQILARAKEFTRGRRLPGYEPWKSQRLQEQSTLAQMRAIYQAVQKSGVSYVKSSQTFGDHGGWSERVRMPRESLRHASANCIDGVVLFASLFENLGMEPVVAIVPGHAYVGVRGGQNGTRYFYLDTALTGRANFEAAMQSADRGLTRVSDAQVVRVRLSDARGAGIYPMPEGRALPATARTKTTASRLR